MKNLSSAWKANHDIQFVLDPYACAVYITASISKSQKGMSTLLYNACKEARQGNESLRKQVRFMGNKFLNATEISAQISYIAIASNQKQLDKLFSSIPRHQKNVPVSWNLVSFSKTSPVSSCRFHCSANVWQMVMICPFFAFNSIVLSSMPKPNTISVITGIPNITCHHGIPSRPIRPYIWKVKMCQWICFKH